MIPATRAPALLAAFLLAASMLAGCAVTPGTPAQGDSAPSAEALAHQQRGQAAYREGRFDEALAELNLAIDSGQLRGADLLAARKLAAFIHCSSGREHSCREQFQAIVAADPAFDLAPNEAGHPLWGPVWRSVKGSVEERRMVEQAARPTATPAQQKLAEGVRAYEAGRYKEAIDALQAAVDAKLPTRPEEIRARKYIAFATCLTKPAKSCRSAFAAVFALDPAFELLPSEAGHPSWAAAYRSERAAAARKASPPKK